jgi:hypothetical protein
LSAAATSFVRCSPRRGVPWREDPTNADRSRVRGRLRHEVLPVLDAVRKGAATRAARTARRVRGAGWLLSSRARRLLQGDGPWKRAELRKGSAETLSEAVRRLHPRAAEAGIDRLVRAMRDGIARPRTIRLGTCSWLVGAREVSRAVSGTADTAGSRRSLAVDQ